MLLGQLCLRVVIFLLEFCRPTFSMPRIGFSVYVGVWTGVFLVWFAPVGIAETVFAGTLGAVFGFLHTVALFWVFLVIFYPCPTCRRGNCCHYTDYVWYQPGFFGYESWRRWRYKCSCDDQYVFDGIRFMLSPPNGPLLPYKRLCGFRKWCDDTYEAPKPPVKQ
jgi:hypothetical protein